MKGFSFARPVATLVLMAGLAGCQTVILGTVTVDNSRPVPTSRLYPGPQPADHEPAGRLSVLRDFNALADACLARIYIDGVHRADLYTADRATFRLAPGAHELKLVVGGKRCVTALSLAPPEVVRTVMVEADREVAYIVRSAGRFDPLP